MPRLLVMMLWLAASIESRPMPGTLARSAIWARCSWTAQAAPLIWRVVPRFSEKPRYAAMVWRNTTWALCTHWAMASSRILAKLWPG